MGPGRILRVLAGVSQRVVAGARQVPQGVGTELALRRIDIKVPPQIHAAGLDRAYRREVREAVRRKVEEAKKVDSAQSAENLTTVQLLEIFDQGVGATTAAILAGSNPLAVAVSKKTARRSPTAIKYKLEVYDTPDGRVVSFVQPLGARLESMARRINAESQGRFQSDAISLRVFNEDPESRKMPIGGARHNIIPLVKGSANNFFKGQIELLKRKRMSLAGLSELLVAEALFRLEYGASVFDVGDSEVNSYRFKLEELSTRCSVGEVSASEYSEYTLIGKIDSVASPRCFAAGRLR